MVGSFYRSLNFLSAPSILYLYKSQIRPTLEYCCYLWAGASHRSRSALDSVQHRLKGLVGPELYSTLQPLSHRRNAATISLFYRYFHGKCSTELHSLVSPLRVFRRQTRYSNDCAKHPFFPKSLNHTTNFTELALFPAQLNFGTPYYQRLSLMNITSINLKAMQVTFFLPSLNFYYLFFIIFNFYIIIYIFLINLLCFFNCYIEYTSNHYFHT